eukprot:TRINITY_DN11449_c0_g1_i1.p1 TRINITY_DN11449_c0_g1~~TRINITY_DN11449_c0_g1_i1.p1  ORF type:complete len:488 (+),score=142.29 TRINITY_DN11449_c0_g1_i1:273-1736(+)
MAARRVGRRWCTYVQGGLGKADAGDALSYSDYCNMQPTLTHAQDTKQIKADVAANRIERWTQPSMQPLVRYLQAEAGGPVPWCARMERLLQALARRHPQVGYRVGMDYVVASMLVFVPEEALCFECVSFLLSSVLPPDLFAQPPFCLDGLCVESELLLPLAHKMIPSLRGNPAVGPALQALSQAWRTLYVDCVSFSTLTALWDELFAAEGNSVLVRSLLAVLQDCPAQFGDALSSAESAALKAASAVLRCRLGGIGAAAMQSWMDSMSSRPQEALRADRARCVVSIHALSSARRAVRKRKVAESMTRYASLAQLVSATHFSVAELESVGLQIQKQSTGEGHMCRTAEFTALFAEFFPSLNPQVPARLFQLMDPHNSGNLDFRELMCALCVAVRGGLEEKVVCCFRIYDTDHTGTLAGVELSLMLKCILRASSSPSLLDPAMLRANTAALEAALACFELERGQVSLGSFLQAVLHLSLIHISEPTRPY